MSRLNGGAKTNHSRLGREELEGEVVCAMRQGADLIRDPLHRAVQDVSGVKSGVDKDADS